MNPPPHTWVVWRRARTRATSKNAFGEKFAEPSTTFGEYVHPTFPGPVTYKRTRFLRSGGRYGGEVRTLGSGLGLLPPSRQERPVALPEVVFRCLVVYVHGEQPGDAHVKGRLEHASEPGYARFRARSVFSGDTLARGPSSIWTSWARQGRARSGLAHTPLRASLTRCAPRGSALVTHGFATAGAVPL